MVAAGEKEMSVSSQGSGSDVMDIVPERPIRVVDFGCGYRGRGVMRYYFVASRVDSATPINRYLPLLGWCGGRGSVVVVADKPPVFEPKVCQLVPSSEEISAAV